MKIIALIFAVSIHYHVHAEDSGKLLADWISVHLKLVQTTKGVSHVAYSRHFAYTSIAFYESVVANSSKYRSLAGQLQGLEKLPTVNGTVARAATANAAYAEMLRYFYNNNPNVGIIDSAEAANNDVFYKAGITKGLVAASSNLGKSLAGKISQWCESDGSANASATYSPPVGDGMWRPTPPAYAKAIEPYWKNNRTMVVNSTANVFVNVPPAYAADTNSPFYKMVYEVYDVSRKLTDEQKNIAFFWDDSPGEHLTVYGHWSSILAQVILAKNIPLERSAEAYAKMCISLYDASIAAWEGKYKYNVVRPVTYIQKYIDAQWLPIIATPAHMEFPAAHATLSGAAATALTNALGDNIRFTDDTYHYLKLAPREFSSFNEAATEAGRSRLYGGIHYSFSINEGLSIGKRTADHILKSVEFAKTQNAGR